MAVAKIWGYAHPDSNHGNERPVELNVDKGVIRGDGSLPVIWDGRTIIFAPAAWISLERSEGEPVDDAAPQ